MKNSYFQEKCIWITGASSGIGLSLSEKLLHAGAKCIVSARNTASLEPLKQKFSKSCFILPLDITESDQNKSITKKLQELSEHIDIAILNAGTCEYVDVQNFDTNLIKRVMNTNFMGTVNCVDIALPLLKKSQQPQLLLMSSAAIYLPFTLSEAYGASKAAIDYFGRCLQVDLANSDIKTSIIYPGFVKTPLTDKNTFKMPFIISCDQASTAIMRGIIKQKAFIEFPKIFLWLLKLLALLPRSWQFHLVKKLKG